MPIDFVPKQVMLGAMFVGTFDKMEAENTAAVMVKILQDNGNVWRTMHCNELADGFEKLTKDDGPWRRWFNNPFARISLHELVDRGFAEWQSDSSVRFTEAGIERMRKWIPSPPPV
jgi:hypothetical protein